MKYTPSEENHLKAIFSLQTDKQRFVNTNLLSKKLNVKASSITDMMKKLADKNLVNYIKYQGVSLTKEGEMIALDIIRKHRLWECFLVNKLSFSWDEVHDVAEQLEHVKCAQLIDKLDDFLGNPTEDPHGDPIPNKFGKFQKISRMLLIDLKVGDKGSFVGVNDSSDLFLKYLNNKKLALGDMVKVVEIEEYDKSLAIKVNNSQFVISYDVANNIYVTK